MKVTKLIREYIEEKIGEKYDPLIRATSNSEKEEAYAQMKERVYEELNAYVRKRMAEEFAPFYSPEAIAALFPEKSSQSLIIFPTSYRHKPLHVQEREDRLHAIHKEMDAAIKHTLISLEMGGTKKDIDALLAEINPTVPEE